MKITIQKFQQLYSVARMDIDELEKSSLLVQVLTDKSANEINDMKLSAFNKKCKQVSKAFDIYSKQMDDKKPQSLVKANGRWYHLNYEITKAPNNAGKYVEVATFSNDIVGNLHRIMATMATPMRWSWKGFVEDKKREHRDIADDMLELEFEVAYHAAVFFYAVFSKSIQNIQSYFLSLTENKTEMEKQLTNLQNLSDGFTTAKWYQNLKVSV